MIEPNVPRNAHSRRPSTHRAAVAALVALLVAVGGWASRGAPAPAQAPCPGADSGPAAGVPALAAATACLVAAERAAAGAQRIAVHPALVTSARLHAEDMVAKQYVSDVSLDGREPSDRALRAGYGVPPTRPFIAEVLGYGFDADATPRAMVRRWQADPASRQVLLTPSATHLGVGVALGAPTPSPAPGQSAATYVVDIGALTDPPVAGQTVVVGRVRGRVLVEVKRGGKSRFVPLRGVRLLNVGLRVDTRQGAVRLTSARDLQGHVQTAEFFDGIFLVRQARSAAPVTELRLTEALAACPAARRATAAAKKKKQARRRRLWGDGAGRFRTGGRYGTAAVIGTRWLVEDSCAGTFVRVQRGVVKVRDLRTGRTRRLRAGQSVLLRR